jgi:hypothetical protein
VDLQNEEEEKKEDEENEEDSDTYEAETDGAIQGVGCPTHRAGYDEWDYTAQRKDKQHHEPNGKKNRLNLQCNQR